MFINQSYTDFKTRIDSSEKKMQRIDQSAADEDPAKNAVKTTSQNGDTYQASTDVQGLHSFSESTLSVSKSAFWKTTTHQKTSLQETGPEAITKTKSQITEKTFRWFPGISTSHSDVDVTEARKSLIG